MSDYIDRQAALERFQRVKPPIGEDGSKDRYRYLQWMACVEAIKEAPAASVMPTRVGKPKIYYHGENSFSYACEWCGMPIDGQDYFCRWCGASMGGEQDE